MSRRTTVARLLGRAFATLVGLIGLCGAAGVAAGLVQQRAAAERTEHVVPMRLAATDARAVLDAARGALDAYLLTGDAQFLQAYEAASFRYGPALDRLRALQASAPERTAVAELDVRARDWWAHADRQRGTPARGDTAAEAARRGGELFAPVVSAAQGLDGILAARDRDLARRNRVSHTALLATLGTLTALAALVGWVIAVRASNRVTRAVAHVTGALTPPGAAATPIGNGSAQPVAAATRRREDAAEAGTGAGAGAARDGVVQPVAAATRTRDGATRPDPVAQPAGNGSASPGGNGAVPPGAGLADLDALALAVRDALDKSLGGETAERAAATLAARARELGVRVRRQDGVEAAADEATAGLGGLLGADHVVVRLARGADGRPQVTQWSRDGAPGDVRALAALGVGWLIAGGEERTWIAANIHEDTSTIPPEERHALTAAQAGAAISVGFDVGTGPAGAVTVTRPAGAAWTPAEVHAVESVAADLCRSLLQAELFARGEQLAARLIDLDNAKTDFMSTVSHELRTPLTSISGYLEMLRDGDAGTLAADQLRLLEVIERNTGRLRALIEDLLILSRIEAGTFKSNHRETDFGWIVGAAVAAVRPAAVAAGVNVESDVGPGLAGHADPDQMDRVLMSLLSNAVKFTPHGGHVQVRAHREVDDIVLQVSDDGMGIPEADQRNLFVRFFRASNATDRAIPGTGLGLAIVHTIVANHSGQIAVASSEGRGTTVTVRLPA